MGKSKSKLKQKASKNRAAKRNKRDIKVKKATGERRVKFEKSRDKVAFGIKSFLEQLDEAKENYDKTNS